MLTRRQLLATASAALGAGAVLSTGVLAGCQSGPAGGDAPFTTEDQQLLEAIADTILPTTPNSPGAKAAGVGPVMVLLAADCYTKAQRGRVRDGLAAVQQAANDGHGQPFPRLSPSQREAVLRAFDAEARATPDHWYRQLADLSLQAYFGTEVGMTKALRYIRVPGHWTGCVPLAPGQPAWG